jgi:hypothetical protein
MGDVGDFFKDTEGYFKERNVERKSNNLRKALSLLKQHGVSFESKNSGIHLIVAETYDYWPTTEKFIERNTKKKGRGIFNLLKRLSSNNQPLNAQENVK